MLRIAFLLFVAAGIFGSRCSYAQKVKSEKKATYESFKSKISVSPRSLEALFEEAEALKQSNPGEALNSVQEALGISLAKPDVFSEGRCYVLLGEINEGIQEWKLALENYTRACKTLSDSYATSTPYKKALHGMGTASMHLGQYTDALHYYEQELTLPLQAREKAERTLDISEAYYSMGRYADAMRVLDDISYPGRKSSDPSFEALLQSQRAKLYANTNDLDKAKDLYFNTQTLRGNRAAAPKEDVSLQTSKEAIADVLHEQKRYDEEITLRNQSIKYNLESNNLAEASKDNVALGKSLTAKGDPDGAIRAVEEAARIADTLNNPAEQATAYLALADLYEKNGRNSHALSAYKKYSDAIGRTESLREATVQEKSSLLRKQKDIEEISKDVSIGQREETIEQGTVARQKIIIYGLSFVLLILITTSYFIYKNAQASKVANQLLALKSLRSQMNPHFIFNALNSVNHFIAQQDERTANKFLSEFSQLMRLVLENSQEDFIPLQKELEILSLYLKLEHYRFRDKFDYAIEIDPAINLEGIEVPPMLVQPYIENAVWHGLRYKTERGNLRLHFSQDAETRELVVEVADDGIGRKQSAVLKTENQKKHTSTGLKNIQQRLSIINKVYKSNYRVEIDDLADNAGTRIRIYLPVQTHVNGL